jgi:hypothetical protein
MGHMTCEYVKYMIIRKKTGMIYIASWNANISQKDRLETKYGKKKLNRDMWYENEQRNNEME